MFDPSDDAAEEHAEEMRSAWSWFLNMPFGRRLLVALPICAVLIAPAGLFAWLVGRESNGAAVTWVILTVIGLLGLAGVLVLAVWPETVIERTSRWSTSYPTSAPGYRNPGDIPPKDRDRDRDRDR